MFGSKAASAAVVMTVAAVVLGLGSPAVAQAGVTSSGSQVADQFAAETSFPHSQSSSVDSVGGASWAKRVLRWVGAAPPSQVTICHATGSSSNPYTQITVNENAISGGHGSHSGDIIPPFTGYAGQNWDANGQSIWNNGC